MNGKETRGKLLNKGKSIRKRDKSVYKRKEFGHWEIDTVVSGLGKSKACFVTLAERKTRYYINAVKYTRRNFYEVRKKVFLRVVADARRAGRSPHFYFPLSFC